MQNKASHNIIYTVAVKDDLVTLQCDMNKLLDYVDKTGPDPLVRGARVAQTRLGML